MKIVCSKYWPMFWFGAGALTFKPWIFIKRSWWSKLTYERQQRLMVHESRHLIQQKDDGLLRFLWRYIFSKEERYGYELAAYCDELDYIFSASDADPNEDRTFRLTRYAGSLSSKTYFNMVTHEKAYDDLCARFLS